MRQHAPAGAFHATRRHEGGSRWRDTEESRRRRVRRVLRIGQRIRPRCPPPALRYVAGDLALVGESFEVSELVLVEDPWSPNNRRVVYEYIRLVESYREDGKTKQRRRQPGP